MVVRFKESVRVRVWGRELSSFRKGEIHAVPTMMSNERTRARHDDLRPLMGPADERRIDWTWYAEARPLIDETWRRLVDADFVDLDRPDDDGAPGGTVLLSRRGDRERQDHADQGKNGEQSSRHWHILLIPCPLQRTSGPGYMQHRATPLPPQIPRLPRRTSVELRQAGG